MFTASENPSFGGQYTLIDIIHEKRRRDNSFFVSRPGKYPTRRKPESGFFLQNDKDPPAKPGDPSETVEKAAARVDTGRKIVTKETQEGCLSFLIIRFWNFFKVSKSSSACQKSLFDKLVDRGASSPATTTPTQVLLEPFGFRPQNL